MGAAFDLAANAQLPASYPSIPPTTGVRTIPPSVLKAVGWLESGWRQFTAQGRPLVSFDFGYGIMQVTSGMAGAFGDADGTLDPAVQSRVAGDYAFNIAFGAQILAEKWAAVPQIGDGDTSVVENWYYALWAYNGWGWMNNPNNPRFSHTGTPATNPGGFPYQERVLYLVSHPPKDRNGNPMWQPVSVSLPSRQAIGDQAHKLPPLAHPHRQPPRAFSAAYHTAGIGYIAAGAHKTLTVRITNTGTAAWSSPATAAVALTYHLLSTSGNPYGPLSPFSQGVLAFGQGVLQLPRPVLPGKSVTVREMIQIPSTPGQYRLVWDLVQGADLWFSQVGGFPRVDSFTAIRPHAPVPTATPAPTTAPVRPQSLLYVADTSIRNGSTVAAKQSLRKGWLVFNNGSAAWGDNWTLHLVSGKSFGAASIRVPALKPCRSRAILATLKAPGKPGEYTSTWRLQTAAGVRIGDALTLKVTVRARASGTPTPVASRTPTAPATARPHPTTTATPAG